jgi:hypothetical protein
MIRRDFNLLKIDRLRTVPDLVSEVPEQGSGDLSKPLQINRIDGAGRGS